MQSADELFDVVDAGDRVIGQSTRAEVHARGLLHRAVHIFVFNTAGQLLVHERSATKDEYPLCFTSSASGHLAAGETYEKAAPRELAEELGLQAPLELLAKFPAGPETANEHTVLFRTITDDAPVLNRDEIASARYFEIDELAAFVEREPERFSPPFRVLFAWYVQAACGGTRSG